MYIYFIYRHLSISKSLKDICITILYTYINNNDKI